MLKKQGLCNYKHLTTYAAHLHLPTSPTFFNSSKMRLWGAARMKRNSHVSHSTSLMRDTGENGCCASHPLCMEGRARLPGGNVKNQGALRGTFAVEMQEPHPWAATAPESTVTAGQQSRWRGRGGASAQTLHESSVLRGRSVCFLEHTNSSLLR